MLNAFTGSVSAFMSTPIITTMRHRVSLLSVLILAGLLLVTRAGADARRAVPEALLEQAGQDFDQQAVARLQRWQDLLANLAGAPEAEQLAAVNTFFNTEVPFISDLKHWQQDDYWATPYEILTTAGADCEDYVIAKYYSLRQLGVDTANLVWIPPNCALPM